MDAPAPLTRIEQVMRLVQDRIATGAYPVGSRIPSIRHMADTAAVSKSTVVEAYDRLAADGAIVARAGSGFYVPAPRSRPARATDLRRDRAVDPFWIMYQSLDPQARTLQPGSGWLPPDWLPDAAIRRHLRALARDASADLVNYGPPLGHAPLRAQLSRRLADCGIAAPPDTVLLTDSATTALDLVCRTLLRPGDTVLIDDPSYYNFRTMLATHHVRLVGVPYTATGPDLEAFATAAAEHAPRLYITNATLHNPTGASPSPQVIHRLLALAERHDIAILEDDIYADFLTDAPPRLAGLDGLERVIHVGSFSKTLSASVRCGFVAANPALVARLVDVKLATSFGNNDLSARLVHALLSDGSYRRHVASIRARLAEALQHTLAHLSELGFEPWCRPKGGLFVWAALPEGLESADIARRALDAGLVLAPGNVFSLSGSAGRYLRFNVAQCADPRVFTVLRTVLA